MEGINWDFIAQPGVEGEATHLTGYVPTDTSGFTIGSFDLGQHSEEDIRRIMQSYQNKRGETYPLAQNTELYQRISPYALDEDIDDTTAKQVKFTADEVKYLTEAKRYEFANKISDKKGWDELDSSTKTILGSVGWQYGLGSDQFNILWSKKDSKKEMANYLRGLGRKEYKGRRDLEANYIDPLPIPVQEVMDENNKIGQIK